MTRVPVLVFYFLLLMTEGFAVNSKPRRSVYFNDMNPKRFKESGFGSLSSLMLRDDIGQLVLGARGKVLTLSLGDVTKKTSEVQWRASSKQKALCNMKGKSSEECENFIRVLHTLEDGKMLVCGTNAFNPRCDSMTFTNGTVALEQNLQVGRGKVPYDPYQRMASLMHGSTLFSATSNNFMGTEMVFQRHGLNPVKTKIKRTWFHDPTMISINLVEASELSNNGEDDNVFLFFTEKAVEERRGNIQVSRIARVCKGDLGGKSTLQKKWTSFLKARLDCPFGDVGSSSLVQDVFLLRDQNNSRDSVFYATFTSNSESEAFSLSAVCAYKLSDISQVFSGRFLTETNTGSWDRYTGVEPSPHPSSCIDNELRSQGVMSSLDLSDAALLFRRNHPLMEAAVRPVTGKPLLVQSSTRFSKIVVDRVTSLDGQQHQVMLIGTESGWLQKAVKFDGEDGRVIEELQLFQDHQPINFLQLSNKTGQLYSGGKDSIVQVDVRDCSRYTSCHDCILARDPYCGWDLIGGKSVSAAGASTRTTIQSLRDGDISLCQTSDDTREPQAVHLTVGVAQFLPCAPDTNLPISWRFSDTVLHSDSRHTLLSQGLVITPVFSDAGIYTCETVESVKGRVHRKTVIQYLVQDHDNKTLARQLEATAIALCVLIGVCFVVIITLSFKARTPN